MFVHLPYFMLVILDRMKSDLVAPGAAVLTAYAHEEGRTVEVLGTSFAAPVVSGNAALVRQYFEEGWLPCNQGSTLNVACQIDPSGSLVKVHRRKKQVQVSPPWLEPRLLKENNEYDNNQGMGLVKMDSSLSIPGKNNLYALVRNNVEINNGGDHGKIIKRRRR